MQNGHFLGYVIVTAIVFIQCQPSRWTSPKAKKDGDFEAIFQGVTHLGRIAPIFLARHFEEVHPPWVGGTGPRRNIQNGGRISLFGKLF
jgi:hypothetical protein